LSAENEQDNIVVAFRACLRLTHWKAVLAGVDESREAGKMQGEPHQLESPSSLELTKSSAITQNRPVSIT
jgi:hypothetical protein